MAEPTGSNPSEESSAFQLIKRIKDGKLNPQGLAKEARQNCVEWLALQGVFNHEIAEILGCSVEAVKWHVFTARKKLKEKLKDYL